MNSGRIIRDHAETASSGCAVMDSDPKQDTYDKVAADLRLTDAEVDALLCANRSGHYWSVDRPTPWYAAETWSVLLAGRLAFRDRVSATSGYYFLTDQAKTVYARLDPISAHLKSQLDECERRVYGRAG